MPDEQRARTAPEVLVLAVVLLAAVAVHVAGDGPGRRPGGDLAAALLLLLAVLVWVLARRISLPLWASGAAVVVFAVCPPVVAGLRTADPVTLLGVAAALVALVLVPGRAASPTALTAAGVAFVAAVVVTPATALLLPGPVLVLWRTAGGRPRAARAEALARTGMVVVGITVLAVALGTLRADGVGAGTAGAGPVVALVAVLAVAGGLALRRVRPLALSAAALLLGVAVPGTAPAGLALLAVAVTSVVLAAVADGFVRYRPTRLAGLDVRHVVPALAAAAAVTAAALVLPDWAPRVLPAAFPLAGGVAAGPAAPTPSGPAPASPVPSTTPASTAPAPATSPDPAPSSGPTPAVTADDGAVLAGRQLAENPRVSTSVDARADLVAGRVDVRVLATLATLAGSLDLGVGSFPDPGGEAPGPLRSVRIVRIGGAVVQPDGPATGDVLRILREQQGLFRPVVDYVSDVGDGSALVLTFPATTT